MTEHTTCVLTNQPRSCLAYRAQHAWKDTIWKSRVVHY